MNTTDCKTLLRDGFHYDLFANRLWLPRILESGGGHEQRLFRHILSASKIWIVRFGGFSPELPPQIELSESALQDTCDEWLSFVDKYDCVTRIDYTNFQGVPTSCAFGDIARQVVNHGTYHRGQLREKFGEQGLEFPETDFLIYAAGRSLE